MQLKTNRLTGWVDAEDLDRFAKTLPRDLNCPVFGHLARMRRTYRRLALQLRKAELKFERYNHYVNQYGEDWDDVRIE